MNDELIWLQIVLAILKSLNIDSSIPIADRIKKTREEIDDEMAKLNS